MSLVGHELRRIVGRRGSFFGVAGVALSIALLAAAVGPEDLQTGDAWAAIIGLPLVFGATVVAALEGSYDMSQGTMRYLVLTGTPRWKLVLVRVPAVMLAITLIAAPAMLVGGLVMASAGEPGADLARGLADPLITAICWGLVAMAVGTLLQSNGAGIAVALVLYLAANVITAVVQSEVSEVAGDYLLPNVISVVARLGGEVPVGEVGFSTLPFVNALIALVIWLVAVLALAIGRVERDEY